MRVSGAAGALAASADPPWRWHQLLASPHRIGFVLALLSYAALQAGEVDVIDNAQGMLRERAETVCVASGRGIVAGLCVAFLGIMADRLIRAAADRFRRQMGISTGSDLR